MRQRRHEYKELAIAWLDTQGSANNPFFLQCRDLFLPFLPGSDVMTPFSACAHVLLLCRTVQARDLAMDIGQLLDWLEQRSRLRLLSPPFR